MRREYTKGRRLHRSFPSRKLLQRNGFETVPVPSEDGPRFFIQSSSSFHSSFYLSFSSVYPPDPVLLVVRSFFHNKVEIIGYLFLYFAPPSLSPLPSILRREYSSTTIHRKVPKCSVSCQIWRFISTIGMCLSLSLSLYPSPFPIEGPLL